jgi:uncharacterized protein (TIGR03435 family)
MIRQSTVRLGQFLLLCQVLIAQKPSFEVASIKQNVSGSEGGSMGPQGDRLVATNMTLTNFLSYAYGPARGQLLKAQIIGVPDWANTTHFDIQAKLPGDARSLPIEQTKVMLQSLLEDRFQLKIHRETRDLPVYNLVLVKGGPKLSEDQTLPDPRQSSINFVSAGEESGALPRGAMRMITAPSGITLLGTAVPIAKVVNLLQGRSDRIIVDKTGFNGLFDIHLEFSPDLGAAAPGTEIGLSLFTAIQDIGLKLESAKAPLEVLVIDRVQKPSEN